MFESQIESLSIVSKDISIFMHDHDVTWFDVPVDNIVGVHEDQPQNTITKNWKECV